MKTEVYKIFQCQNCYTMSVYYLHYEPYQAMFIKWWWVCDSCGAKSEITMARSKAFWDYYDKLKGSQ